MYVRCVLTHKNTDTIEEYRQSRRLWRTLMGFAPHTNTDIRNGAKLPLILGSFIEADYGHTFEYAIRPDEGIDFAPDCPHIVYVGDGVGFRIRYARVLKTVAYIAVDEDDDGEPVLQKWQLKNHRQYPTEWVHA